MNNVLVFKSNLAGRHEKDTALYALRFRGAIHGKGEGRQGRSYALPLEDYKMNPMPLDQINKHIITFLRHAKNKPQDTFLVTLLDSNSTEYSTSDIVQLLRSHKITSNVVFAKEWLDF